MSKILPLAVALTLTFLLVLIGVLPTNASSPYFLTPSSVTAPSSPGVDQPALSQRVNLWDNFTGYDGDPVNPSIWNLGFQGASNWAGEKAVTQSNHLLLSGQGTGDTNVWIRTKQSFRVDRYASLWVNWTVLSRTSSWYDVGLELLNFALANGTNSAHRDHDLITVWTDNTLRVTTDVYQNQVVTNVANTTGLVDQLGVRITETTISVYLNGTLQSTTFTNYMDMTQLFVMFAGFTGSASVVSFTADNLHVTNIISQPAISYGVPDDLLHDAKGAIEWSGNPFFNGTDPAFLLLPNGTYQIFNGIASFRFTTDFIHFSGAISTMIGFPPANHRWFKSTVLRLSATDYRAWYTDFDNINNTGVFNLALSTNGLVWTQYAHNPIFVPSKDWEAKPAGGFSVDCPYVLRENGLYKMWFSNSPVGEPTMEGYMTSSDGINWTEYAGNPIIRDAASPIIVHVNGIYYNFPNHFLRDQTSGVYAVTASEVQAYVSLDGINWKKWSESSLMNHTGCFTCWRSQKLFTGDAIWHDNRFIFLLNGARNSDNLEQLGTFTYSNTTFVGLAVTAATDGSMYPPYAATQQPSAGVRFTPSSGTAQVNVSSWDPGANIGAVASWNTTGAMSISYEVTGLSPTGTYTLYVDGTKATSYVASPLGVVSFQFTGSHSLSLVNSSAQNIDIGNVFNSLSILLFLIVCVLLIVGAWKVRERL